MEKRFDEELKEATELAEQILKKHLPEETGELQPYRRGKASAACFAVGDIPDVRW